MGEDVIGPGSPTSRPSTSASDSCCSRSSCAARRGLRRHGISAPGPWVTEIEADGIRHIPWSSATRAWNPGPTCGVLRAARDPSAGAVRPGAHAQPEAGRAGSDRGAARRRALTSSTRSTASTRRPRIGFGGALPVLAAEWIAARFSDLELYQSTEDLAGRATACGAARPVAATGQRDRSLRVHAGARRRGACDASSAPSSASARTSWSWARSAGWSCEKGYGGALRGGAGSSAHVCRTSGSWRSGSRMPEKADAVTAEPRSSEAPARRRVHRAGARTSRT